MLYDRRFATLTAILLAIACILAFRPRATAAEPPSVFDSLRGHWKGTGTLLRRPATFRMSWQPTSQGFVRLTFSNTWVDEAGTETPVLSAEAVYYPAETPIRGVWIDDRPQRASLEATVTDSSLVTIWTADQERGRTEYVVRSADDVVVRDWVEVESEFRLFGEAVYTRHVSAPEE